MPLPKTSFGQCLLIISMLFVINGFHFTPSSSVFYANTSFLSQISSSEGTNVTYPMLLATYTSIVLLPNQCLNFSMQACSDLITCSSSSTSTQTIEFPYFNATGPHYTVNFTIEPEIQENTLGLVPSSCDSGLGYQYGAQSYGLIGMGILANSPPENSVPIYFSIYLGPDAFSNVFLLFYDTTKSVSDTPVAVLDADADWHVKGITNIQVGSYQLNVSNTTNLIFDMNFNAIGLPLSIYSQVLTQLNSSVAAVCQGYGDRQPASCTYNGEIQSLPNITVSMNNQTFSFIPQVYVENGYTLTGTVQSFNLNLRALDGTLQGLSFVTPIYEDYIILGSPAMTYYYTVFNTTTTGSFISLYQSSNITIIPDSTTSDNSKSSLIQILIIVAIMVACALLYIGTYFYLKKHRKNKANEDLEKENETKQIALISMSQSDIPENKPRTTTMPPLLLQQEESHSPGGPSPVDSPIKKTTVFEL